MGTTEHQICILVLASQRAIALSYFAIVSIWRKNSKCDFWNYQPNKCIKNSTVIIANFMAATKE